MGDGGRGGGWWHREATGLADGKVENQIRFTSRTERAQLCTIYSIPVPRMYGEKTSAQKWESN